MNQIRKLEPSLSDQERESSVAEIELLLAGASSEQFKLTTKQFLECVQSEDEVFEYCSSQESWNLGKGSAGFVLKRGGKIVNSIICKMN